MNKVKKKCILYFNNGDFNNTIVSNSLFSKLVLELENEGKKLEMLGKTEAIFDDGSTVLLVGVSEFNSLRLRKMTHFYISEDLFNNKSDIYKKVESCILEEKLYNNVSMSDRVFTFNAKGINNI